MEIPETEDLAQYRLIMDFLFDNTALESKQFALVQSKDEWKLTYTTINQDRIIWYGVTKRDTAIACFNHFLHQVEGRTDNFSFWQRFVSQRTGYKIAHDQCNKMLRWKREHISEVL